MPKNIVVRFDTPIIKVGHVFTRATKHKYPRWGIDPLEDWGKPPVTVAVEAINVTVLEMHAYGKSFQELGHGMTAMLVVEGLDDRNWDGWVFGDYDHESIVIVN